MQHDWSTCRICFRIIINRLTLLHFLEFLAHSFEHLRIPPRGISDSSLVNYLFETHAIITLSCHVVLPLNLHLQFHDSLLLQYELLLHSLVFFKDDLHLFFIIQKCIIFSLKSLNVLLSFRKIKVGSLNFLALLVLLFSQCLNGLSCHFKFWSLRVQRR